ncbi:MAG: hypothetical protein WAT74_03915 [Flavobacteriales bacterium]
MDPLLKDSPLCIVCDHVIARLKSEATVMSEGTMWDDYKDHVEHGSSLIADGLDDCVKAWIELELEKIPDLVLRGLWLQTTQGQDLLFEVRYALEHHEAIDPKMVQTAEEDYQRDLIARIIDEMNLRAEAENLDDAEAG